MWKQRSKASKRVCLLISLLSWFGKWKITLICTATQGNAGPRPTSVRCTHKDNENVQTGTHSVSALCRERSCTNYARNCVRVAILHIFARAMCSIFESTVRTPKHTGRFLLFAFRDVGLFLIALSYLIRCASVAGAPISLGGNRCFWRRVFCIHTTLRILN